MIQLQQYWICFGLNYIVLKNIGQYISPNWIHYLCNLMLTYTASKASKKLFNPLPDDKILDWTKLKQIADDILKCI